MATVIGTDLQRNDGIKATQTPRLTDQYIQKHSYLQKVDSVSLRKPFEHAMLTDRYRQAVK